MGACDMPSILFFCLFSVVRPAGRAFVGVTGDVAIAIDTPVTVKHSSSSELDGVGVELVVGALVVEVDGLHVDGSCCIHREVLALPRDVFDSFTKDALAVQIDKGFVFVLKAYACLFTIE